MIRRRASAVCFLAGVAFAAAVFSAELKDKTDWPSLIVSKDENDRLEAKALLDNERKQTIEHLLAIVRMPFAGPGDQFYVRTTPRNIAIGQLGAMRAAEAIPDLIECLEPKRGLLGGLTINFDPLSPAGRALANIGMPSVPPVVDIIRQKGCSSTKKREAIVEPGGHVRFKDDPTYKSSPVGDRCLGILREILGDDLTEFVLHRAFDKQTDAVKKEKLNSALEQLKARREREQPKED